jgi:hypothetical protein
MGLFRTVCATLDCTRCGASFRADVQFKTGDDWDQRYEDGEVVSDLEAAEHRGVTDSYCSACDDERAGVEVGAYRDALLELASSGAIRLSIESAEAASLFEPLVAAARGRRVGELLIVPGGPPLPAGLEVFLDEKRVWPLAPGDNPWTTYQEPFWIALRTRMAAHMMAAGFPEPDFGHDVIVKIDEGRAIRVLK